MYNIFEIQREEDGKLGRYLFSSPFVKRRSFENIGDCIHFLREHKQKEYQILSTETGKVFYREPYWGDKWYEVRVAGHMTGDRYKTLAEAKEALRNSKLYEDLEWAINEEQEDTETYYSISLELWECSGYDADCLLETKKIGWIDYEKVRKWAEENEINEVHVIM